MDKVRGVIARNYRSLASMPLLMLSQPLKRIVWAGEAEVCGLIFYTSKDCLWLSRNPIFIPPSGLRVMRYAAEWNQLGRVLYDQPEHGSGRNTAGY